MWHAKSAYLDIAAHGKKDRDDAMTPVWPDIDHARKIRNSDDADKIDPQLIPQRVLQWLLTYNARAAAAAAATTLRRGRMHFWRLYDAV